MHAWRSKYLLTPVSGHALVFNHDTARGLGKARVKFTICDKLIANFENQNTPFRKRKTDMKPVITVEFSARAGDEEIKEESVPLHSPEEFFAFVAPDGGCESIPDEVGEIKMFFLPPEHPNTQNPVADLTSTLQLGIVFFTGPLSEIAQISEQLLDKAGRGELSESFLKVIGV
jgi:hypothetical protein